MTWQQNNLRKIFIVITFVTFLFYFYSKNTNFKVNLVQFSHKNFRPDYTLDSNGTLPFVSGANFVLYADYVYDNHVNNIVNSTKYGDVLYVYTDFIEKFFKNELPKIKNKFILLTHNSDHATNIKHIEYLNSEKIIVWFGQNPGFEHKKFIPLPIGFENPTWVPSKLKYIRNVNEFDLIPWKKRKYLLYINFSSHTNPGAREYLLSLFANIPNVLISKQRVDYPTYMSQIENSKYVLCPRGNGLDTHRYYETILMGSIPVVENSTLFPIFSESTTLILSSLNNLTVDILNNPRKHVKNMGFSKKVLYMETWINRIKSFKVE